MGHAGRDEGGDMKKQEPEAREDQKQGRQEARQDGRHGGGHDNDGRTKQGLVKRLGTGET